MPVVTTDAHVPPPHLEQACESRSQSLRTHCLAAWDRCLFPPAASACCQCCGTFLERRREYKQCGLRTHSNYRPWHAQKVPTVGKKTLIFTNRVPTCKVQTSARFIAIFASIRWKVADVYACVGCRECTKASWSMASTPSACMATCILTSGSR